MSFSATVSGIIRDKLSYNCGTEPAIPVNRSSSKTEARYNFKFQSYEEIIVSAIGQYLELSGNEQKL